MSRSKFLLVLLVLAALLLPSVSLAGERILAFHSEITVTPDASMEVTETIKVVAEREEIKRGIFRDFPTEYVTPWGFRKTTGFKVLEVKRDGRSEPFHLAGQGNGSRVYIGSEDVLLPAGTYTYTIRYGSERQLGFFPDHDELYWNVTGNGWAFPIDEATATVTLPGGIPRDQIKAEGYTGYFGYKDRNLTASVDRNERAVFRTTAVLDARQGLTIVVTWPKGFVRAPTKADEWYHFLQDNRILIFGLFGLLGIFAYYLIVWHQVGRDPSKGTIIPLFEAPDGLTPAAVRTIWKMGYDDKVLAAALIHLAVGKFLKIVDQGGTYTLQRGTASGLPSAPDEKHLLNSLLAGGSLEIKRDNRSTITGAVSELKKDLKNRFEKSYFLNNRGFFIGGLLVTVVALLASLSQGGGGTGGTGGFMLIWLTGWSVGVFFLVRQALANWQSVWSSRGVLDKAGSFLGAIFSTLFALPFLIGEVIGLYIFGQSSSWWMVWILLLAVFLNLLFFHLLKAPTLGGRKVLDKIEGLRMYLGVAEKDRLNALAPPKKTPEVFEKFLAYALALDVDQEWSEQFADVLTEAGKPVTQSTPVWYAGAAGLGTAAFTSSLGSSLTGAISSASVAPSSSSGSSGGGSSGGGGGGGGGGGW